jgi:hypothetical protein
MQAFKSVSVVIPSVHVVIVAIASYRGVRRTLSARLDSSIHRLLLLLRALPLDVNRRASTCLVE